MTACWRWGAPMSDRQAQILQLTSAADEAMDRADQRHRHARNLDRAVSAAERPAYVAAAGDDAEAFALALSALRDAVRAAEDFSPCESA